MKTITQAATAWGVTKSCVRLWIKDGKLTIQRLGPKATMILDEDKPITRKPGRPKRIILPAPVN